ncbi:MAG: hypothetical protein K6F05_00390 [Succinivibrio sp.]|nr:hypothetical protein [Succinivibrio sp.]
MKTYNVKDFGATGSGTLLDTEAIQQTIDKAAAQASAEAPCKVTVPAGIYLITPIYLKSYLELELQEGAILRASTDESLYPLVRTRVAGIEMDWYPGLLNIEQERQVTVSGRGVIDGQGPYWWRKYWGDDCQSGMRREYDAKGLRWVCDYDCIRLRNVVVKDSEQIVLRDFTSSSSGFWNIHLLYSNKVLCENLHILENRGPSTDGIDVDSCCEVTLRGGEIDCNDDCISLKSGRDADGLRVKRVCRQILIEDCLIRRGCGVTIGSETAGGIEDVEIRNLSFKGTDCGVRLKSAPGRGGFVRRIKIHDLNLENVRYAVHFNLFWHPLYSSCSLPEGYTGSIPEHWEKLLIKVPKAEGETKVSDLEIYNLKATTTHDFKGRTRAFDICARQDNPILRLSLRNAELKVTEFGRLCGVEQLTLDNVEIAACEPNDPRLDSYDNR